MENKVKKNIIIPIEFNHVTGGMIHSVISLAKNLTDDYEVYFLANKQAEVLMLNKSIKPLVLQKQWSISIKNPVRTLQTYLEVRNILKDFKLSDTLVLTNNVGSELIFSGFGFCPIPLRRVFISRGGDYLGKTGWFVKKGFNSVERFVCTSLRQLKVLENAGVNKQNIETINDGVESDVESFFYEFKKFRKVQLTVVGYVDTEKNQKLIVESLKLLKDKQDFSFCLNIFGAPSNKYYVFELKELINRYNLGSDVIFHGYKQNKNDIYHNTDILISSSISEGFGRTIAEAMAYGIPTIGLKISGGLLDIITDRYDGFLIDNDKYQLAEIISTLCNNKSLRDNISKNALMTYKNKFTEEIMCDNYLKFIKQILK